MGSKSWKASEARSAGADLLVGGWGKEEVMTSQVLGWNSWMDSGVFPETRERGLGRKPCILFWTSFRCPTDIGTAVPALGITVSTV